MNKFREEQKIVRGEMIQRRNEERRNESLKNKKN